MPNEGQILLNMETITAKGQTLGIRSTFQVAEMSRPLMRVSKVCDQGHSCVFNKDGAKIVDPSGNEVCSFRRVNGLYVKCET